MTAEPISSWLERLERARQEVAELAESRSGVLTSPDEQTGEQWTGDQVLAHFVEFVPYWLGEATKMADSADPEVTVGRTKQDPARLEGVRVGSPTVTSADLVAQALAAIDQAAAGVRHLSPENLAATGRHHRRGKMTAADLLEVFVIEHVEEHVQQLRSAVHGPAQSA